MKLSQWNQHLLQSSPALLELWSRLSTLLKLIQSTFLELRQWNQQSDRPSTLPVLFQWNRRSLNCRRSLSFPSRHFKSSSTATTTASPYTSTADAPEAVPVESSAPGALDSTADVPEPLRNRQFSRQYHGYSWRNRLIKEWGIRKVNSVLGMGIRAWRR